MNTPEYLAAQAARHVEWLARLGIDGDHGLACLTRVHGWPSLEAPANHLYQTCPCCRLVEARGDYCTRCRCRTGPADWQDARSEEQRERIARARAQRGRSQAKNGPGRETAPKPAAQSTAPVFTGLLGL